jgi:hypothetical protein
MHIIIYMFSLSRTSNDLIYFEKELGKNIVYNESLLTNENIFINKNVDFIELKLEEKLLNSVINTVKKYGGGNIVFPF